MKKPTAWAIVMASLMTAVLTLAGCQPKPLTFSSIDISGAEFGHDFQLTDPDGKTRTLADYRGKAVLLFFGFTQCPDVCPTALARAAEVRKKLGTDGERLQVIFVTIDPERDLPPMLKAYTAAFDPSFIGLHTDLANTAAIAKDFRIYYQKIPTGSSYTMDHTTISYAYDPEGKLRLAVQHERTAEQVANDIRMLLANSGS